MKKKEVIKKEPVEYFRLLRTDRNLFTVETIKVENGVIVETQADVPAYLPIAFDKMRRKTADSFFAVVNDNR